MTGRVSGSWLVAGRKEEEEPIDGVIALEIKKKSASLASSEQAIDSTEAKMAAANQGASRHLVSEASAGANPTIGSFQGQGPKPNF